MLRKSCEFIHKKFCSPLLFPNRSYWHRMGYKPKNIEPGMYPFPRKQVPIEGLKSYEERIHVSSPESPIEPVNIGFKHDPPNRVQKSSRNVELEALARRRQLKISTDEVHSHEEDQESPLRRYHAAVHYGIFKDLFGPLAYFTPVIDVPIFYPIKNSSNVIPVYIGNQITAEVSQSEPLVDFSQLPEKSLWTLIMTCPDEPFSKSDENEPNEYIHWMMQNSGTLQGGDLIVDYLPPLPYFGTGFHRYVFVLYRQDNGPMDFSNELRGPVQESHHVERRFSTAEFYRRHQDHLTPAGLSFFQAAWDISVRSYIREYLPIFEVEFPLELPPPQARFPLADSWFHARHHPLGIPLSNSRLGVFEDVSFDVYLDRYRDRREMDTELVKMRLANEGNPLDEPDRPRSQSEFPLISPRLPTSFEVPSWWRQQEIQRRLRKGRWAKLEGHED
ncbi:unnamed protein product [Hymenolepis diminuta]|uniref:Large ribosomal subunit protein mL38 n=1 Tax=Hymenolepis diminuta TaxID=6216 RepID=A0A0R3SQM6_HYMDI|nr:unnamed protein product [Hymenolepis diminuta]